MILVFGFLFVTVSSRLTGEIKQLAIEAISAGGSEYLAAKAAVAPRLRALMPLLEIRQADVDAARVGSMLAAALDL